MTDIATLWSFGGPRCSLCWEIIAQGDFYVDSEGDEWDIHKRCWEETL